MPSALPPFLLLASIIFGLSAVWAFVTTFRARRWPAVEAQMTLKPESTSEKVVRRFLSRWNVDSDYLLEWKVDNKTYHRRIDNDSQFSIGGLVIWAKPPDTSPRRVRYNPHDPSTCVLPEEPNNWKLPAVL